MASKPFEPPESIIVDQFRGLNNVRSPERLANDELSIARNAMIDDAGQLRMRHGFTRDMLGDCHSFKKIAGRTFVVKDGVLGVVAAGPTFTPVATVGSEPLSYTSVGDTVYASSTTWSGQISPGNAVSVWGVADDPGIWVSPVMTPTATMGAISGRQLIAPPLASLVEEHNGRIYLAVGNVLWATELFLYSKVDLHRNFVQFEHPITMLYSGGGGLFVGTEKKLYFLSGTFSEGMKTSTVLDAGVVKGSLAEIPAPMVHPGSGNQLIPEGDVPVFLTGVGICVGLDGGEVHNLTQGRIKFPPTASAAAYHRNDDGQSQYVVATPSGTAWAMNTRSKAVTEYTNYAFTGLAAVGDEWLGCAADGIYTLVGEDDAGDPIDVWIRGGLMRFGGTRLSRLKAVYITARSEAPLTLTLRTGDGLIYGYETQTRSMRTTKIHFGKGMRATQFLYEITGQALDLDVLELVPIVVQRRV